MMVNVDHLKKHYRDFNLDASLAIQEGCITGLIGANGAGKSTTFKAILNLIHPDSGRITVFGKDAGQLTPQDREKIGVVLSDSGFSGLLNGKQIADILEEMYSGFDRKDFMEKCRHFSIPMDKGIKEFSTGMKAKLKVIAAVTHGASLLILDEPTAGLDVIARDEVLELIREYMETEGRAVLISSHISSDLEGLCDDIYMIHKGRIVMHEETDVLLDSYGLLKVSGEQLGALDQAYLLRIKREPYGYSCLTRERAYYQENYPELVLEKGTLDEIITMMVKGEAV